MHVAAGSIARSPQFALEALQTMLKTVRGSLDEPRDGSGRSILGVAVRSATDAQVL